MLYINNNLQKNKREFFIPNIFISTLWIEGLISLNYAYFLDYAVERKLIQRIGGQYRFLHDSLRKYFADQSPIPKSIIKNNDL